MTRRKPLPVGSSWQDAQRNAPGAYVPDYRPGTRSDQSEAILAWLEARSDQGFSAAEIHLMAIHPRWPLWQQGRTTSRLSTFCNQGTLRQIKGGLYQFVVTKALEP